MTTVHMVVCIGNSDNRLTQQDWHEFTVEVDQAIGLFHSKTHFCGTAPSNSPWQNMLWLIEVDSKVRFNLQAELTAIRKRYNQDSAFVMYGEGIMV